MRRSRTLVYRQSQRKKAKDWTSNIRPSSTVIAKKDDPAKLLDKPAKRARTDATVMIEANAVNQPVQLNDLINRLLSTANNDHGAMFEPNYVALFKRLFSTPFTKSMDMTAVDDDNSLGRMVLMRYSHCLSKSALDSIVAQFGHSLTSLNCELMVCLLDCMPGLNHVDHGCLLDISLNDHGDLSTLLKCLCCKFQSDFVLEKLIAFCEETSSWDCMLSIFADNAARYHLAPMAFQRFVNVSQQGFKLALCVGANNKKKNLDGFIWLKKSILTLLSQEMDVSGSSPWLRKLFENNGDVSVILSCLPFQGPLRPRWLEFVRYFIGQDLSQSKCSLEKQMSSILLDKIHHWFIQDIDDSSVIWLINTALNNNNLALELLCRLLSDRKISLRYRSCFETALICRLDEVHKLQSPSKLLSSLLYLIGCSSSSRNKLFNTLLNYSRYSSTANLSVDGLLVLLSNTRITVASVLQDKLNSQASHLLSLSQPTTQRHMYVCATSLDLIRRHLWLVLDKVHLLIAKNAEAIGAPIMSIILNLVLDSGDTVDTQRLLDCGIICLSQCPVDENLRNENLKYFMERVALALRGLARKFPDVFLNSRVELELICEHLNLCTQLADIDEKPWGSGLADMCKEFTSSECKPAFVSELGKKIVLTRLTDTLDKCVDDPFISYGKSALLNVDNLKPKTFNDEVFQVAITKASTSGESNLEFWLQVAARSAARKPDSPELLRQSAENSLLLTSILDWVEIWAVELDPATWTPWLREIQAKVLAGEKFKLNWIQLKKILYKLMSIQCSISHDPFKFIEESLSRSALGDDDNAVVNLKAVGQLEAACAGCLLDNINKLWQSRKFLTGTRSQWTQLLDSAVSCACQFANKNHTSPMLSQKIANCLEQMYSFLVAFVTMHQSDFCLEADFMSELFRLTGSTGLQSACAKFVQAVEEYGSNAGFGSKDAPKAGTTSCSSKSANTTLARCVPALVRASDVYETTLIAIVQSSSHMSALMRSSFKLTTCRDFRIDRNQLLTGNHKLQKKVTQT